jgi:streptomycin 3"-adenylyltransferase
VTDLPADQQEYLDRVVSTLRDGLGPDLIGVYLHGSLAMGAFTPGRSDIDALAVCAERLPVERRTALGGALAAIPMPASGGDLELTLLPREALDDLLAPVFEVHVRTHADPPVVDGHEPDADENLLIDAAMTRARGRALYGPEPADVFPEPNRTSLIEALRADVELARREGVGWWTDHDFPEAASMAYQVLNAARILRYLETGELGSKAEGAAWLEAADPDPEVHAMLAAAMVYQRGGTPDLPDPTVVDAFLDRVQIALRDAG